MMNDDLSRFLAKEQNTLDHLTAKIYGPGIKFEKLSAWGQHTIEALARERSVVSDVDPELRTAKAQVVDLSREIELLTAKLAESLRNEQELWEENEQLKMELYDAQENNSSRSTRRRKDGGHESHHYENGYDGKGPGQDELPFHL